MGAIYGLEYDYLNQNGQSIVFTKKEGKKLTVSNLNAVQLKMIQSNRIPHMLAMSLENIDLVTKLHYDINSKQKVMSYFQNNSTTMNDYYQLFISIINTLEDAGSFMLDQNNYLLQKEFIYIGEHAGDVYMTYLPVQSLQREGSLIEDMKKLLTDVAGEVDGLQGNEFKSILNYIKNPSFSLAGLKKVLLELISLRSQVNKRQTYTEPSPTEEGEQRIVAGSQTHAGQKSKQSQSAAAIGTKEKKKLKPLSSRGTVYLFVGAALLIAISWKIYDLARTEQMLVVSSILTGAIVAGVFVFWKVWRPGGMETVEVKQEAAAQPSNPTRQAPQTSSQPHPVQAGKPMHTPVQKPAFQVADPSPMPAFAAAGSPSFPADTTMLAPENDDTVLLGEENDLVAASMEPKVTTLPEAKLVRKAEGEESSTIRMDARSFLIGRNADAVDYADAAVGVSRIHAEIIRIDNQSYGVKDLGSKNGSKLNGDPMVPYKVYALKENDVFELGKAHYTFQWSNSQ